MRSCTPPLRLGLTKQAGFERVRFLSTTGRPKVSTRWWISFDLSHTPAPGPGLQDPTLYHSNVHHASHHQDPQPATAAQVAAELQAIEAVARDSCALTAVLERVVVTPGGVLMACWQVGTPSSPWVRVTGISQGSRLGAVLHTHRQKNSSSIQRTQEHKTPKKGLPRRGVFLTSHIHTYTATPTCPHRHQAPRTHAPSAYPASP